ncbi:MAG: hypothetical protein ACP5VS_05730, partial [Desulfomonilaceae bacterium]
MKKDISTEPSPKDLHQRSRPWNPTSKGKIDIGALKSLRVEVLSETGWFDNTIMTKNMMDYGGMTTSQYEIPWDSQNAGGYSALITATS